MGLELGICVAAMRTGGVRVSRLVPHRACPYPQLLNISRLPKHPGSFGQVGVSVGGLGTFWGKLFGIIFIFSEKKFFFTKFGVS